MSAASAISVVLAFALAGCSSGGGASEGSGSSPLASSSGAGSTTTSVSVPVYRAAANARPSVAAGSCVDSGMGWVLDGTVANTASGARRYSIVVDFVTALGNTVVATRVVEVGPVAPRASATWSTPAAAQGQTNLSCVIRQALWSS